MTERTEPQAPALGSGGGVDEAGDAGVEDGSGAHGAGFERGVEGAVFEAVVARGARPASRRATISAWAVGSQSRRTRFWPRPMILPVVDDDCAYGDFAGGFGGVGFGDGGAEVVEVGHVMLAILEPEARASGAFEEARRSV